MPETIYRGHRPELGRGRALVTVTPSGMTAPWPLNPRHDLRNHSPDGFEWGYAGSGPAQLALALCADALGDDERAQAIYQAFKFRVILGLSNDTWELTRSWVLDKIIALETEMSTRA
jgi:hypothetical protein